MQKHSISEEKLKQSNTSNDHLPDIYQNKKLSSFLKPGFLLACTHSSISDVIFKWIWTGKDAQDRNQWTGEARGNQLTRVYLVNGH